MSQPATEQRPWGQTNDGHLRIDKADPPNAVGGFDRRLRVSSALPHGLHIDVSIENDQGQSSAGINLTPAGAVQVVAQIAKVLGHGSWDLPSTDAGRS